ncbi:MAG: acetyltransferase [Candidatus Omnitrophota bacterium]|nr:acetyltransferase [Candidatus Omnitrophota bacterium]
MAKVVIFGAGDIARLAHYYFLHDSEHEVVAFAVDKEYRKGGTFLDLPLIDFDSVTARYPVTDCKMFVALSYNRMNHVRAEKYALAKKMGYELLSYVSSRCSLLTENPVGENCFILEDNTIQPFATVGNNVTLWSGNHIGHDSVIGDHCFITSHVVISGNTRVGDYSFIGVNATLRNGITIANETLIGAGAVIMKNTVEKGVYLPPRAVLHHKKSDEIEL